ncbi:MAG: FAD-dependent oxidoreductase [Butyricicoccus sp.]|nr:FAD-dependent oxidoreductase [Butyricicoccus sp.]
MNKIAIVGFGGAGYHAAAEARKRDASAQIDVYADVDIGPYNPMLTTYYVKGSIGYDAMFPFGSLEDIAKRLDLNFYGSKPVAGLTAASRTLRFSDGSEAAYDNILISTGASALMPPIPGIELPGVMKMRTAADAAALKGALDAGKIRDALVIGASWVGIKVVEDLVERGVSCTLVDGAKWMFCVAAFEQTAQRIHKDLESKGVSLAFEQMLSSIEQEPDGRLTAVMQNGNRFTADMVAVCIGIRPNVGFLKDSGLELGRAVSVDKGMRTNVEGIYAAGDCCETFEKQSGVRKHVGVWANAGNQGMVAGANMTGGNMEFDANILVNLAHYLHFDFISIGDITTCKPDDETYEYEDERYYIRAVRKGAAIKCVNVIGSAESNGILKNTFLKALSCQPGQMDVASACKLKEKGFPDRFIDFMGGKKLD